MNLLTLLMLVGVLATATSLVMGIRSMAHGGDLDEENRLMTTRVALQGGTLLILLIALVVANV